MRGFNSLKGKQGRLSRKQKWTSSWRIWWEAVNHQQRNSGVKLRICSSKPSLKRSRKTRPLEWNSKSFFGSRTREAGPWLPLVMAPQCWWCWKILRNGKAKWRTPTLSLLSKTTMTRLLWILTFATVSISKNGTEKGIPSDTVRCSDCSRVMGMFLSFHCCHGRVEY